MSDAGDLTGTVHDTRDNSMQLERRDKPALRDALALSRTAKPGATRAATEISRRPNR